MGLTCLSACTTPLLVRGKRCSIEAHPSVGLSTLERTAHLVDILAPQVAQKFEINHPQDIRVRIDTNDRLRSGALAALSDARPQEIWLSGDCYANNDLLRYAIAHELMHLYIQEKHKGDLPYVIEEGLAEHLGLRYRPLHEMTARFDEAKAHTLDSKYLKLGFDEVARLSGAHQRLATLSGFHLVLAIGFEESCRMLKEGKTSPAEWIAAAGLHQ